MDRSKMTRRALLASGLAAAISLPARALARHYRLRLIAGTPSGGLLRAGIDVALDEGWKTYWRMPGDAGVPPQFDWSGSENIKAVEVLWPAPSRIIDAGGEAVGYKDRVVFPLRITPEQGSQAARLRLAMFFAVCKEICIPASDRAELGSWQSDPAQGQLLASFEGRVPARAGPSSPLRVIAAHPDVAGGKLGLRLTLAGRLPEDLDIFVESKDTSYFHAPQFEGGNTCVLALAGAADPLRLAGAALKLTMVGRNLALEQDIVVA